MINLIKRKKEFKKIIKSQTGSITVLVLSSIFIILIVLLNLYMLTGNSVSSQKDEITQIQKEYMPSNEEINEAYYEAGGV